MTASDPQKLPVYRFGEFELDCARRELRQGSELVAIQPKAFELLRYLVEHRDRAVDKDELQDALWPRSIVTEASLTRSVMKARRAVGDDSERQAVIRTVHGHGYRFVAELDERPPAATQPPEPVAAELQPIPAPPRRRSWMPIAVAAVLVAVVAGWWGLSRDADAGSIRVAVLPVANDTGDADLDWVGTGLMSLMNRLLEDRGIDVIAERPILALAERHPGPGQTQAGSDFMTTLRQTENVTHTLEARLGYGDGVYRLEYTVRDASGRAEERTAVDNAPAGMVPAVAESAARLLAGKHDDGERRRTVSEDPFINEAFARGLSLEFAGRFEEAQQLFRVVMEQEPGLFWPRYEYALCARNLREWDVAVPLLEELIAEADAEGAMPEKAAAMNALGVLLYSRDEFDAARRLFEDTLRIAEAAGEQQRIVTANVNLGLVAKSTGDIDLARLYLEKAIELTYAQGIESLPGALTNNMSGVLIQQGRFDEAERYSQDAVANFRLTGNRLYEASALSRLSTVLRHQGKLDDAEETQELALALRTELGSDVGRMSSYLNLASIARERGNLRRARRFAEQGHEIGIAIDDRLGTASALAAMADADRSLGDTAAAVEEFGAAADIFAEIGDKTSELRALRGLASSYLAAGDTAAARAVADEMLGFAVERERRSDEGQALVLLAEIHRAEGLNDDAVGMLERALGIAIEIDDQRLESAAVAGLAQAYLDFEQPDDAEPHVRRLAELQAAEADTARLGARLAFLRGDLETAVGRMQEARERAGETWSPQDAERLAHYRAALGSAAASPDR